MFLGGESIICSSTITLIKNKRFTNKLLLPLHMPKVFNFGYLKKNFA